MHNIKNVFTIQQLVDISGIKAHTIRIWEKRYGLFNPMRASRNIRYYGLEDLKKILNVALLYKEGFKISKIAALSDEEIIKQVKEVSNIEFKNEQALATLKITMYGFDAALFEEMFKEVIKKNSFSVVFQEIFVPFLNFVGLFWQTDTISVAHEHFITNLIYQKILLQIELLESPSSKEQAAIFVLFLPEEEMHEVGLLYLNYEFLKRGYRTIYLGRSLPIEDLKYLKALFPQIYFVSTFTITPQIDYLKRYFSEMNDFLEGTPNQYWAISRVFTANFEGYKVENIHFYTSLTEVMPKIEEMVV